MSDHAHGFWKDYPQLVGRRALLAQIGAAAILAGGSAQAACVADALETAGPFPADGGRDRGRVRQNVLTQSGVMRQDIRSSFGDHSGTADGAATDIEITLLDAARDCAPLAGRPVYIWHCDAMGLYSLYDDPAQNYLRGVGVTDSEGKVRFTTIFPAAIPPDGPISISRSSPLKET